MIWIYGFTEVFSLLVVDTRCKSFEDAGRESCNKCRHVYCQSKFSQCTFKC